MAIESKLRSPDRGVERVRCSDVAWRSSNEEISSSPFASPGFCTKIVPAPAMTKRDLSVTPLPPAMTTAPPPLPPVQVKRQSGLPEPPLPKSTGLVIEPYVAFVAAPESTPAMPPYEPDAKKDPLAAEVAP